VGKSTHLLTVREKKKEKRGLIPGTLNEKGEGIINGLDDDK